MKKFILTLVHEAFPKFTWTHKSFWFCLKLPQIPLCTTWIHLLCTLSSGNSTSRILTSRFSWGNLQEKGNRATMQLIQKLPRIGIVSFLDYCSRLPLFHGRQLCCTRRLTWCGDQTFFFLKSLSHMAMTAALLFIIKIRRWTFSSCSCWLTAALPPLVEPIICQDGDSFPCLLCSWLWESKVASCQPHLKI